MDYTFAKKTNEEQYLIITSAKLEKSILGLVINENDHLIWHVIKAYVGDINSITNKYLIEKDDLYQVGCIGFIKSIKDFDITKGVKFSTYAVPKIYREIKCFLRDNGSLLRLTRTASELACQIENLNKTHGDMTPEEMSSTLKVSVVKINKALTIGKVLYAEELENDLIHSQLADDVDIEHDTVECMAYHELIDNIMDHLDMTEKEVFRLKYLNEINHKNIAQTLSINKLKVSRIVEKIKDITKEIESEEEP